MKTVDFEDTDFAQDVITENERIVFSKRSGSKTTSKTNKPVQKKSNKYGTCDSTNCRYEDFSFNLFGDTIDVYFHDQVFSEEDENHWIFGNSNYAEQVINISLKRPSGNALSPSQIKQTFVHECVHIMLESGQFYDESYNEALVEWLAKCINMLFMTNKEISSRF